MWLLNSWRRQERREEGREKVRGARGQRGEREQKKNKGMRGRKRGGGNTYIPFFPREEASRESSRRWWLVQPSGKVTTQCPLTLPASHLYRYISVR